VLESGLRAFESPAEPPRPRILADSLRDSAVTRRPLDEGISVAHFSVNGARLTGHAPILDGPVAIILGDSYVMAREVSDDQTMGGQLERIARSKGIPLNVRQYGWWGASAAQYILMAPTIRKRWGDAQVIIALSENDLDARANLSMPMLLVDRQARVRIVGTMADTLAGPPLPSTFWMLVQHRWATLRRHAPSWARPARRVATAKTDASTPEPRGADDEADDASPMQVEALPEAIVRELASAYGQQLSIAYIADVGISGDSAPTSAEDRLIVACRAAKVRCISTRTPMLDLRRRGLIAHGLSTKDITLGHLNPVGHGVVGQSMWELAGASWTLGVSARR
jgi:hypothetical protein